MGSEPIHDLFHLCFAIGTIQGRSRRSVQGNLLWGGLDPGNNEYVQRGGTVGVGTAEL